MNTYRVNPLPLKTQLLVALSEATLPLAIESVVWPHRIGVDSLVCQGIICVVYFFFLNRDGAYDIEVDEDGIREVRNGQVDRAVSSARIRHAKERGWGVFRGLVIAERIPALPWRISGGLTVPATMPGYEQVKARVLSWIEHPRAIPQVGLNP